MATYTSKPYTVEAIQFTGTNLEAIVAFVDKDLLAIKVEYPPNNTLMTLETTSGVTQAQVGYWVINNEKDLWYCMSDKDFKDTFVAGTPKEDEPQEKAR